MTAQSKDKQMAADVCKLLQKWRNIPDIVYSVNINLWQQPLPTTVRRMKSANYSST